MCVDHGAESRKARSHRDATALEPSARITFCTCDVQLCADAIRRYTPRRLNRQASTTLYEIDGRELQQYLGVIFVRTNNNKAKKGRADRCETRERISTRAHST